MSRSPSLAVDAVIHEIYDTAAAADAWPSALADIANLLKAAGGAIVFKVGAGTYRCVASQEVVVGLERLCADDAWVSSIFEGSHKRDGREAVEDVRVERIATSLAGGARLGWQMSARLLPADLPAVLVMFRKTNEETFNRRDMTSFRGIAAHVERSLRLGVQFTRKASSEQALVAVADAANAGVYILDGRGKVLFANAHARANFDTYFVRQGGCMVPRAECERRAFQAMLSSTTADEESDHRRSCFVTGADGNQLVLWPVAILDPPGVPVNPHDDARLLLFATPLQREAMIDPMVLRDLFELALGQARLAVLVGSGMELRIAAERRGVTEGTARVVLKRVFRKLRINRQVELALLLSSLAQFSALVTKSPKPPRR